MNIWKNYKRILHETFPLHNGVGSVWAEWEAKGTWLTAKTYTAPYIIKSREVEIWNEKSCIYNNIIYPKTGSNLPCFGMDLMGFNENRVIIVFDFQHPTENYMFSHPNLPVATEDYRFFEKGNHFSENIFVRKCKMDEVDQYVGEFAQYLDAYKKMVDALEPDGVDTSVYADFDAYMTRLDPVGGYLKGIFGEDRAEQLVKSFLFCYNK